MKTMQLVIALLVLTGFSALSGCGSSSNPDSNPKIVGGNVNPNLKGPVSRGGPVGSGGVAAGGGTTAKSGITKK